ncbi:NAD(P)-binding protein [Bradyrhizobium sp. 76]|uniref:FAD-dependent oxidoreductase n=1 Tax=Bradyrhizobium sp. 76 TaxID=2782680 RepID=UPI001FFA5592|nr:NAD(P)-binding protein [Bradyrhizobium sp. 76]MCK1404965.1 NAD(P)-binding protein [Bradyrhizobium sp. 76]
MEDGIDIVILGAGISGLVSASVLLKQGYKSIIVVDEYDHVGGNHIDCSVGEYTFDIGSFIFQDDSPLLVHLPEILPLYVPIEPTWGRLNPQGVVTQYPISIKDDLIAAGPIEWVRVLLSVAFARLFRRRLSNAKDFAQFWIGARLLHRSGLGRYMERFYGLPPEQIDIRFAEKRMLWIKEHAMIRRYIHLPRWTRGSDPRGRPNRQLARPREGFAHLYDAAIRRMKQSGVQFLLGTKLEGLSKADGRFVLQTADRQIRAQRVVSTIPLERAQELCGIALDVKLRTVTLITLFFSFSGHRGFKNSILYNFSHSGAWKRLTVYSDFYGPAAGREFFAVEVNADHVSNSAEIGAKDFRQHTMENGLFKGDLQLEGSHVVSNAYPIYTNGADERAAEIIAALRNFGVQSLGRQGAFDYQPTARDTTLKAEAALRVS